MCDNIKKHIWQALLKLLVMEYLKVLQPSKGQG